MPAGATLGLACLVVGGVIGAGLSGAWNRAAPASPPKPEPARSVTVLSAPAVPVPVGPVATKLSDEDKNAIRSLIRDELAAERARGSDKDAAVTQETSGEDAPRSPSEIAAFDRARAVIDQGLARRAWTEADRALLRESLAGLPTDTRIELVRPLIVAVNANEVRVEGRGPLF